jgi:hypothetical protein
MLHAGFEAEKIPRQMKPCDLPAAITQEAVADDGTAEHPINEPDRLTLPKQNRTRGEGRSGCCCRIRKCTAQRAIRPRIRRRHNRFPGFMMA